MIASFCQGISAARQAWALELQQPALDAVNLLGS